MKIINKIKKTFPNLALFTLALELEWSLEGCNEILDVGCGSNSPLSYLTKKKYLVGVDGYKKSIDESKKRKIHDQYFLMDALNIGSKFKRKSFDAVVALDVIEHLPKNDGIKLLKMMENLARKKVILLTPNGFVEQHDKNNPLQQHLSGWSVEDFEKMGYQVSGIYGWKPLRKEEASIRFKPRWFWVLLSELTHYFFTKYVPKYSYSLFAEKDL